MKPAKILAATFLIVIVCKNTSGQEKLLRENSDLPAGNVSRETTVMKRVVEQIRTSKSFTFAQFWQKQLELVPLGRIAEILSRASPGCQLIFSDAKLEQLYAVKKSILQERSGAASQLIDLLHEHGDLFFWDTDLLRFISEPDKIRLVEKLSRSPAADDNPWIGMALWALGGAYPDCISGKKQLALEPVWKTELTLEAARIFEWNNKPAEAEKYFIKAIGLAVAASDSYLEIEAKLKYARFLINGMYLEKADRVLVELNRRKQSIWLDGQKNKLVLCQGVLYLYLGQARVAIKYFEEMYGKREIKPESQLDADILMNKAYAYDEIGEFQRAHALYDLAEVFYRENENVEALLNVLLNRGVLHEHMHIFHEAEHDYRQLLAAVKGGRFPEYMAGAYMNLGNIDRKRMRYVEALANYKIARGIYEETNIEEDLPLIYANLAEVLVLTGDGKEADQMLGKARAALKGQENPECECFLCLIEGQRSIQRDEYDTARVALERGAEISEQNEWLSKNWSIQYWLAECLEKQGRIADAINRYKLAWQKFRQLEDCCDDPYIQIHMIGQASDIVEGFLRCAGLWQKQTKNDELLLNEIVQTMDEYRFRILQRRLQLIREKTARQNLFTCAEILRWLKKRGGVGCMLFEGKNSIFLLYFDDGHARMFCTPLMPELKRLAAPGHDAGPWTSEEDALLEAVARKLFPAEMREAIANSRKVFYLPDGQLSGIPLEIYPLVMRGGEKVPVGLLSSVQYISSWSFALRRSESASLRRYSNYMGIAPGKGEPDTGHELKWAHREIELPLSVADFEEFQLLDGLKGYSHLRQNPEPQQWDLIHIAAHIRNDAEVPWKSCIVLEDRKPGVKISLEEIQKNAWPSELVVLSGCSSAMGKGFRGEGPVSLARAFLAAGAKSVLTSVWPVSDQASYQFMKNFYESVPACGGDLPEAVRLARKKMRREPAYYHPYYWGGYVLLGNPAVAELGHDWKLLPWGVMGMVLLVTGLELLRNRRKKIRTVGSV